MKFRFCRPAKVFVACVLMLLVCSSALAMSISCEINDDTKVYNAPSTSAKQSLSVSEGLEVTLTASQGSWGLVRRDGVYAFIPLRYLTFEDEDRVIGYVAKTTSKLYKRASSSSGYYGRLGYGTQVYISGIDGSYFRVENKDGSISGYMTASHLTPDKPKAKTSSSASSSTSSTSSSSSTASTPTKYSSDMTTAEKIEYVIYIAQTQYGKPYSSDANPPSTFDCSRFVKYCFDKARVSLSGSAVDQGYDDDYRKISLISDLKRGDLVCFDTNSSDGDLCDHTGIYLGDGYFVHASSAAGKVVVSKLSSGYYKNCFSWGRRILG